MTSVPPTDPIHPLQLLFWVGSILAALAAIATLVYNFLTKRWDRKWETLQKAESIISDLYLNSYAHYALRMVDGSLVQLPLLEEFQTETGKRLVTTISEGDVASALMTEMSVDIDKPKARTICHCFDVLFYQLNRLEIYLSQGLIEFEDIRWQLAYYMTKFDRNRDVYDPYLQIIAYPKVRDLIRRFGGWREEHNEV